MRLCIKVWSVHSLSPRVDVKNRDTAKILTRMRAVVIKKPNIFRSLKLILIFIISQ